MNSNFRHYLLSLSLLIGVAAPWAATAQAPISNVGSGSVDERVTQLERISNAHSQVLTQLQQQLADSQNDVDSLRGQIQENQYQLNQIVERQKQIYQQIDSLQNAAKPAASSGDNAAAASSTATAPAAAQAAPASTGNEDSDYNAATSLALDKKQYDQAITAFQDFIKQYPKSRFQPNAHYWLGQLYYSQDKKDDAAYHYAIVVKNYPKSAKSAEAMFKVGVIMQDKGQKDKAKAVYQQVVKQYPDTDAAKQAQKRISAQ